jgi:hypothetical protein
MAKNDTKQHPKPEDWPGTVLSRDELDSALEAGEESGASPHTIPEIVQRTLARLRNG